MILDKIYKDKENLNTNDLAILINMFFKIKNVQVDKSAINSFVTYLVKLNEHPFLQEFNKFKSITNILIQDLIPTIEHYLEIMKINGINGNYISCTYNVEKYKNII